MSRFLKTLIAAAVVAAAPMFASAATVGHNAGNRPNADTYSNFAIAFTGAKDTFSDGIIKSWTTNIKSISTAGASTGIMGLVVLDRLGTDMFRVARTEVKSVSIGRNVFTSNLRVYAGQVLGIYMADAKVGFDVTGRANDYYTANGVFTGALANGTTFTAEGATNRVYSIKADVAPVPVPASLSLAALGLGALGLFGRRKARKTA